MTDKDIQNQLLTIESYSVFATSIRMAAKNDLPGCLQMIRDQAKDNQALVEKIIGKQLLIQIFNLRS